MNNVHTNMSGSPKSPVPFLENGDSTSDRYERLFERYDPKVHDLCQRIIGTRKAENAAQQVWVDILTHLESCPLAEDDATLGKIAAISILEYQEKEALWMQARTDTPPEKIEMDTRAASLAELALSSTVSQMPGNCIEVLHCRVVQGLSRAETIKLLNLSRSQYRRKFKKAQQILRKLLAQERLLG